MRRSAFVAHIADRAGAQAAEARSLHWRATAGLGASVVIGALGVAITDGAPFGAEESVDADDVLALIASVGTFIAAATGAGLHLISLLQAGHDAPTSASALADAAGVTVAGGTAVLERNHRDMLRGEAYARMIRAEADRADRLSRANAKRTAWLQRATVALSVAVGLLVVQVIANGIVVLNA